MRRPSFLACAAWLLLLVSPASALESGTVVVGLEATSGTADLVSPASPYLSAFDHGELGMQGQLWYLMNEDWAMSFSGGVARARERNTAPGVQNRYYQQRAWSARIGVDRMIPLSSDVVFFMGPGVEYWSGHANFIGFYPEPKVEAPEVKRWSGSARFGAMVVITDSFGLSGHIGYRMGYATASDGGAESGWYTNGYVATAGVAFAF